MDCSSKPRKLLKIQQGERRGWEENLRKNHDLKKGRYNQLAIDLREGKHVGGIKWRVVPLCVEVGCRGAINEGPWFGMCRRLGFTKTITRRVTQAALETAVMCSYYLFLSRFVKLWEQRPRMGVPIWKAKGRALQVTYVEHMHHFRATSFQLFYVCL